jgi:ubiquinone/menaquinone biosynthesis C-methylase UbiE
MALRHFTPLSVSKTAARFLAINPNTKVLDIGSGVGKFCVIGAIHTGAIFHGIEKRKWMVDIANEIAWDYDFDNVKFFHTDMLNFPVKDYEAIYFFNSFHENIDDTARIDNTTTTSSKRYEEYNSHLKLQLDQTKQKTRLATYWVNRDNVPQSFMEVASYYNDKLILWEKKW